jgi:hypothetical protein
MLQISLLNFEPTVLHDVPNASQTGFRGLTQSNGGPIIDLRDMTATDRSRIKSSARNPELLVSLG